MESLVKSVCIQNARLRTRSNRIWLGLWLISALGARARGQAPVFPDTPRAQLVAVDNGVFLEVLDWGGKGRPVVLLAGLGDTAHVFDQFAPKLTDAYHVYGITRRGFGKSSVPRTGYQAARLGEDVYQVLIALKLNGAVLAGHSVAGEELSAVGARHSDKIAGLIYLDAASDRTASTPAASSQKQQEPIGQLLPEEPKGIPGQFVSPTQAVIDGVQKPDYEHIRVPALAIYPVPRSVDEIIPGAGAIKDPALRAKADRIFISYGHTRERMEREFETGVANSRVVELPGATHYVFRSNEADVLREMRSFLDGLR